jgi:hypothetical protein
MMESAQSAIPIAQLVLIAVVLVLSMSNSDAEDKP